MSKGLEKITALITALQRFLVGGSFLLSIVCFSSPKTSENQRDHFEAAFETAYYLQDPLKNSALTQTTYSSFNLAFSAQRKWRGSEIQMNSTGSLGLNCESCTYFEVPELNVGIFPESDTSIYIGRKRRTWSELDKVWALGLWQPRFMADGLRPIEVGLTGFQVSVRPRKTLEFTAFLSPIFIPERGTQVNFRKSQLTRGDSPWFLPPPTEVSLFGKKTEIDYKLANFNESEIVFNPSLVFQTRIGEEDRGLWSTVSYAYKPRNQLSALYHTYLKLMPARGKVDILPALQAHHVLGLETGMRGRNNYWCSLQYEKPVANSTMPNRQPAFVDPNPGVKDTLLAGAYASHRIESGFLSRTILSAGWIHQIERRLQKAAPDSSELQGAASSGYASALRAAAEVPIGRYWSVSGSLTQGLLSSDSVATFEARYQPPDSISVSVMADFLSNPGSDETSSIWGRFRGNDRILASFSYVF
jgi:hypothetical protein